MTTKLLAGCIISDDSGKVLLIHRNTPRLVQWELPGGKVEAGEKLAETAVRETLEEIGLHVDIWEEFGVTNFEDDGVNWEYHWFMAASIEGLPKVMEHDKFDDIAYFDLLDTKLAKNKFSPNIINLIAYLQANNLKIPIASKS